MSVKGNGEDFSISSIDGSDMLRCPSCQGAVRVTILVEGQRGNRSRRWCGIVDQIEESVRRKLPHTPGSKIRDC